MQRRHNRFLCPMVWNLVVWMSATTFAGRLAAQAQSQVAASPQGDQQAQIEKGRQVVAQACATCHTMGIMRMVQAQKNNTPEDWRDTVYSMIGRGAEILPDEIEPLTAFLVASAATKGPAAGQAPGGGGGRGGARGAADQQAPEAADGKAILQRTCQQCHDAAMATKKLPSEDWNAVIAKMMTYGAKLTPAEQQKLIEYLKSM